MLPTSGKPARFRPARFFTWALLLCVSGLGMSGCRLGTASAASRGQDLFQTCAPCHGADGSGNSDFGAPNIAGMKTWYVQEELEKFRAGTRGTHFNDVEGMRMRPMALSLMTDDNVKLVAAYVESLPIVQHADTLHGDAKAGEALYATCSSCHGDAGGGNEALEAPRISGVNDWYLAAALRKFKSGVRGSNPKDREGRLMRTQARPLADEEAIRNVVAYIETLKP